MAIDLELEWIAVAEGFEARAAALTTAAATARKLAGAVGAGESEAGPVAPARPRRAGRRRRSGESIADQIVTALGAAGADGARLPELVATLDMSESAIRPALGELLADARIVKWGKTAGVRYRLP